MVLTTSSDPRVTWRQVNRVTLNPNTRSRLSRDRSASNAARPR